MNFADVDWPTLAKNVALAALAAFVATLAATKKVDSSALIAGGYAALRAASGVFYQATGLNTRIKHRR